MTTTSHTVLVAIVGGSGAGKSWLVERLCQVFGDEACQLALDDFYRDRSHLPFPRRQRLNYDIPHAISWADAARVLRDCRAGLATRVPCYDFATYSRSPQPRAWLPRRIVFVEGLWLLRPPGVRALFDLKIFLDAPASLRAQRRLARDTVERGYTEAAVLQRLEIVRPMHDRYVEPQRRWADLVVTQPFRAEEIEHLARRLWSLVAATLRWDESTFRNELLSALVEHEYRN